MSWPTLPLVVAASMLAAACAGRSGEAPPTDAERAASDEDRLRAQVATWDEVPYRDNGTTRDGIDNAGFVHAVIKSVFDLDLPSKVDDQLRTGKLVDVEGLQAGDLVFFESKGLGPFRSRSVGVFLGRGEVALANKELGVATIQLTEPRWRASFKTGRRVSSSTMSEPPVFDAANYGANRAALLRDVAEAWVGTLYKQGGTTFEGIGNDEFVRSIYEAINDAELDGTPKQWTGMGTAVKRDDLEPGDIVLYEAIGIGKLVKQRHAGMYVGDGEFVHAMKGSAVTISSLADPRWNKAYRVARRIEPDLDEQDDVASAGRQTGDTAAAPGRGASAHGGGGGVVAERSLSDSERQLRQATAAWLGTPYKLGGTSKSGVDCSAFVQAVYQDVYRIDLPRTAEEQERLGMTVDRQHLQTGDLVFFRTKGMGPFFKSRHVGVYVGRGEFAQASGRQGVNITTLSNRYWSKKYESARRLRPLPSN